MNSFCYSLLLASMLSLKISAQPAVSDDLSADMYNAPTAIGVTILSNPSFTINTSNDFLSGVTLNHNTLQLNVTLGLSWSLQVRVTDDLRYQSYSIPASAIGLQTIGLGARPEIFLSTTNQTLSSGLATSLLNAIMLIRYRVVGGNHLLKPAGSYSTTLVFTYSAL